MMTSRMGLKLLGCAVLFLQLAYSAQSAAYNPNQDPNVAQPAPAGPPVSPQTANAVSEFERLQPGSGNRARNQGAPSQPEAYTRSDPPAPASQTSPYPDPYLWHAYGWAGPAWVHACRRDHASAHRCPPGWIPPGARASVHIPWWSLLRFTKHH